MTQSEFNNTVTSLLKAVVDILVPLYWVLNRHGDNQDKQIMARCNKARDTLQTGLADLQNADIAPTGGREVCHTLDAKMAGMIADTIREQHQSLLQESLDRKGYVPLATIIRILKENGIKITPPSPISNTASSQFPGHQLEDGETPEDTDLVRGPRAGLYMTPDDDSE